MDRLDNRWVQQGSTDSQSLSMTQPRLGESHRFIKDISGGDKTAWIIVKELSDTLMIGIAGVDIGKPGTRINENVICRHFPVSRPYNHRS